MKCKKLLRIKPVKVEFIKKDFIENLEINYEEYLTEFINKSKFVDDNGVKKFKLIKKQSNGEYDITNGNYSLDYKLLIDSKTTEGMSYYSETISIDKDGAVTYGASKKTGKWRRYFFINILKGLSKKEIERIENSKRIELNEI